MGNTGTGDAFARTLAHEIAHGAFVLEHTFDAYPDDLPPNQTDNLMDYNAGTHLYKWQWDLIHDPVNAPFLEGDESGEMVGVSTASDTEGIIIGEGQISGKCFYVPSRAIIQFNNDVELTDLTFSYNSTFPLGSLNTFVWNDIKYVGIYKRSNSTFIDYYNEEIFEGLASPKSIEQLEDAGGAFPSSRYRILQSDQEHCDVTAVVTDPVTCLKVEKIFESIFYTSNWNEVITNEIDIPTTAQTNVLGYGCGPGTDIVAAIRANPNIELTPEDEELLAEIERVANELGRNLLSSYEADAWANQSEAYSHLYFNYSDWGYSLQTFYDRLLAYKEGIDNVLADPQALDQTLSLFAS